MSELSNKYKEIIDELDKNIKDEKQLGFVKNKVSELSMIFIDIIDRMSEIVEEHVIDIEKSQESIEKKIAKIENSIDIMERDLCDDVTETEIVCPYCNNEFFTELDDKAETDVECPECHNIIELGMCYEEDFENKGCSGCGGKCGFCNNCEEDNNDEDM